jgi:hypothetical protein
VGIGGREITCQRRWLGWRDYINLSIFDFSILLVRLYVWYDTEHTTMMVQIFGMKVINKVRPWPEPQHPVEHP